MPAGSMSVRSMLAIATMSLAACGPVFVSPVLLDAEVAFDSLLLGAWVDADPDDSTRVERADIARDSFDGYLIAFTDADARVNHFTGRLGRFAGHRVLELVAAVPSPPDEGELSRGLVLPLRTLMVIHRLDASEVRFSMIEPEPMEQLLRTTPGSAPGATPWLEVEDDRLLLTGDSEQLREFLRGFLLRRGALGEVVRFRRVRRP